MMEKMGMPKWRIKKREICGLLCWYVGFQKNENMHASKQTSKISFLSNDEFERPESYSNQIPQGVWESLRKEVFLCSMRLRIQLQALWTTDAVVGIHITNPILLTREIYCNIVLMKLDPATFLSHLLCPSFFADAWTRSTTTLANWKFGKWINSSLYYVGIPLIKDYRDILSKHSSLDSQKFV